MDVCAGGVVVHPGDLVIGDANGVVVLRPSEAKELVEAALAKEAEEVRTRAAIQRGETPPLRMAGASPRSGRTPSGKARARRKPPKR